LRIVNDRSFFFLPASLPAVEAYQYSAKAFIFSLHNKERVKPFKSMIHHRRSAIYSLGKHGPEFGAEEIYIADHANTNENSFSRYFGNGGYYTAPSGMKDGSTILAGSQYFTPDEWEVFYRG